MDTKPATKPNGQPPTADQDQEPNGNHEGEPQAPPAERRTRIIQVVQAANLQRLAYDAANALGKELTKDGEMTLTRDDANALAQLVRAWDTAADRLRVLKGKGLPAAVKSRPGKGKGHFEAEIIQAPIQAEPAKAAAN